MIKLRPSLEEELAQFVAMEQQLHAIQFINATDLQTHLENFKNQNIVYLSIVDASDQLMGYFILVVSPNSKEVEFHRILIDYNQRGIGQIAISEMEHYCREEFDCKRIWLDVYEDNVIGKHIYEKLGYSYFNETLINERKLLFYEKQF